MRLQGRFPQGSNVRAARLEAGLTKEQVSVQIGRGVYALAAYERGELMPPIDVLQRIAATLGTTVGALLDERVSS